MRTSNKKNKKIIKIIIFSFALILSYFLVIRTIHLKEGKDLFIDALSILSMIHNNRTEIIYDYIKRGKHNLYVVCNIEFKNTIPDQYMIASKIFLAFTFRSQRIVALANHVSSNNMEMCFCN